jgi:hypothetical protein
MARGPAHANRAGGQARQSGEAVLLLVGPVLVVRSLQNALTVPLGFDPRHVALVTYDLQLQGYDETRARQFQKRLLDNVRSMPGIETAALIDSLHSPCNGTTVVS